MEIFSKMNTYIEMEMAKLLPFRDWRCGLWEPKRHLQEVLFALVQLPYFIHGATAARIREPGKHSRAVTVTGHCRSPGQHDSTALRREGGASTLWYIIP